LFHPIGLADFLQFNEEGDPRTFHLRVDFAKTAFSNTPAGSVCHELGTLGLERIVWNRGAFMDSTDMCARIIFARYEYTNRHRLQCKRIALDRQSLLLIRIKKSDKTPQKPFRTMKLLGANGLSGRLGLGLLSDVVGLLRSCVEFQEVIVFSRR